MINYYNFLVLVTLLVLIPGPDYILITKNTLSDQKIGGFKTILGTCTALVCHTLFATLGLSAILVKSAFCFPLLNIVELYTLFIWAFNHFYRIKKKKNIQQIEIQGVRFFKVF